MIVSGPSGSGKSTLVKKILELPGTMLSVSCTTRPPRKTESDGKWYNFVSEAEFQQMVARGEFLEYAQVFGKNWYGTPQEVAGRGAAQQNKDLVLEIDVQGALQVKQQAARCGGDFCSAAVAGRIWSNESARAARIRRTKSSAAWNVRGRKC